MSAVLTPARVATIRKVIRIPLWFVEQDTRNPHTAA